MPVYLYECPNCKIRKEEYSTIEHRDMKFCDPCLDNKMRVKMEIVINFQGRINGNCATNNS